MLLFLHKSDVVDFFFMAGTGGLDLELKKNLFRLPVEEQCVSVVSAREDEVLRHVETVDAFFLDGVQLHVHALLEIQDLVLGLEVSEGLFLEFLLLLPLGVELEGVLGDLFDDVGGKT